MAEIVRLAEERLRRGEALEVAAVGGRVRLRIAGWELLLSPDVAADMAELLGECALDCGARELEARGLGR